MLTILYMNSVLIIDESAYCLNCNLINQFFFDKYIICSNFNAWIVFIELLPTPAFNGSRGYRKRSYQDILCFVSHIMAQLEC